MVMVRVPPVVLELVQEPDCVELGVGVVLVEYVTDPLVRTTPVVSC